MADYYTFREFAVEAHGDEVTVVGKPGVWSWDRLNPGTAALLEVAEVEPGDDVLDLGCGTGVIGAVASSPALQGHVTLVDCNVAAVTCAERTLAANGVSNAEARLADGVIGLSPASFDLVLSHLPRGRAVQQELIRGAAWVLRPGGRFYFVASKRAGVKGAVAYARELFGRCGVVRQKKGYHVALAVRPARLQPLPPVDGYVTRTITLDDAETTLVSKPGVFAWDRLDAGSEALVDAMEISPHDRVLDLGCGTGLAGLAAARRAVHPPSRHRGGAGQVVLVDADARAVESARRTLEANSIANAEVLLSDCGSAVLSAGLRQAQSGRSRQRFGRRFDVVITNPPFHQGVGVDYEVACQFVRDAARVLRRDGRLFLVANRFLRYGDLIRDTFGNVATAYADNRYHVLTAVARKPDLG
ncbi:MAG: methyltransferase [Anaerolineae bacterium]|nr:methyltransferase [Anaerolineae bacterium]